MVNPKRPTLNVEATPLSSFASVSLAADGLNAVRVNIERPMSPPSTSMLDVRCSMLGVRRLLPLSRNTNDLNPAPIVFLRGKCRFFLPNRRAVYTDN